MLRQQSRYSHMTRHSHQPSPELDDLLLLNMTKLVKLVTGMKGELESFLEKSGSSLFYETQLGIFMIS